MATIRRSLASAVVLAGTVALLAAIPSFAKSGTQAAVTATTMTKTPIPHWGDYSVVVTVPPQSVAETISVSVGSQTQSALALSPGLARVLSFYVHLRTRLLRVRTVSSGAPVPVRVAVARQPAAGPPPVVPTGTTGATGYPGPAITFRAADYGPYHHLVFSDEFNSTAGTLPNPSNWTTDSFGGCGNHTLSYNTSLAANASTNGAGSMAITTALDASGDGYTSAQLDGADHYSFIYGRIEARIEMPAASGLCNAFWLSGDSSVQPCFPGCGELDIMEAISHFPNRAFATLHGPVTGSGNFQQWQSWVDSATALTGRFHTYGIIWSRGRITWTIDGAPYATATPASLPPSARWVFNDQRMHLVLDLAVGGWPGAPTSANGFPATMHVDWIRVYD